MVEKKRPSMAAAIGARFVQIAIGFGLLAAALFLPAGRLDWLWAWVLLGIYVAAIAVNAVFMFRRSPETIAERGRPGEMRTWDKVVGGLWGVIQYVGIPFVGGLDLRFGWTGEMGTPWHVAGAVLFAAGLALFGWAMITNAYFSTVVRIQDDRGQTVCTSGPYRFVRHPGYAGANLQSPGMALLLGSLWALVPGLIAVALMTLRTHLEDRTLWAELTGYEEYVRKVRYRLVPGVW
jgi:protein-S-isoprenylcysteine O-methyltransferase Ste14